MFSEKRGQSALEYLMTYGWALVVIVIVIAALVFLIQPSQVGGNTCSTTSGILITNHQVNPNDNNMTLILSNQTATTLSDLNIVVSGTAGGNPVNATHNVLQLGTTSQTEIVDLTAVGSGTYSLQVTFQYNDRDGLERSVTSTCNGTATS